MSDASTPPSDARRSSASRPALTLRELTPADLDTVVDLLRTRDGRPHEREDVAQVVQGLEPTRLRAWGAFVDGEPAGLTTFYLRRLRGWSAEPVTAGYWGHLYVLPEHRRLMVYPLLIRSMLQGGRDAGCDLIFTATRQPEVAEGHQRLGFQLIGRLPVRFRPLRPFRLLARQRRLGGAAERLAGLGDALYRPFVSRPLSGGGTPCRRIDPASPEVEPVVELMNATRQGRVSQVWSAESFRRRCAGTIDGAAYTVLAAGDGDAPRAAVVYCEVTRGENVRAGVLLEVVSRPGDEPAALALTREAERRLLAAGCDVVLHLDGRGSALDERIARAGYRVAPHEYHMLIWSPDERWKEDRRSDLSNWWFAFSDHDAF